MKLQSSEDRYKKIYSALKFYLERRKFVYSDDTILDIKHLTLEMLALWNVGLKNPAVAEGKILQEMNNEMDSLSRNNVKFSFGDRNYFLPKSEFIFLFDEFVASQIEKYLRSGYDTVVYGGSGWGRHIMLSTLKNDTNKSVSYFAADLISDANDIAAMLPSYYGINSHVEKVVFDFRAGGFPQNSWEGRSVLFVSVQSMEQVEYFDDGAVDRLVGSFASAHKLAGLHIEPISFQIKEFGEMSPEMKRNELNFVSQRKLNKNLWDVLKRSTSIELKTVLPGFIREGNLSRTLIKWSRKTADPRR